ncbi:hypothetical protein LH426_13850 [Laribacter hongkongensis]|uniref:hypothetical protein n=1 Tax=Laribacter hongkongensis TaxID=168471 RepID=UPI001EFE2AB8|nr:hypothetical protein [Laribacter hongkongensis]MCG9005541.1 hypothetical protein [Laribacter hongkongensis]MCG9013035.1 hypothetical protein [Laribacter hongkongensis]MCG9051391.1 hypothetical protein [Laribacter hongkongensis]
MTDESAGQQANAGGGDQSQQQTGGADGGQQQVPDAQGSQGQQADAAQVADGQQQEQKTTGAPERYDFKAPEGMQFDAAVIEQFSGIARELNLPQDAAQQMLDRMAPALQARQSEQLAAASEQWITAAKADQEFGGEQLAENLGLAKRALDQFGTAELKSLLNDSGLGNHPEVIRFMVRAGKAISEDRFVAGTRGASGPGDDPAKRLFPNHA